MAGKVTIGLRLTDFVRHLPLRGIVMKNPSIGVLIKTAMELFPKPARYVNVVQESWSTNTDSTHRVV
ncbi:hypothetical protein IH981_01525 [Patescibacteria group bacterium]|nr:hypothetical protein [Patescibacteria group bacterium]